MAGRWGAPVPIATYAAPGATSPSPMDVTGRRYITIYFVGTGTVASGEVTIEEAPTQTYTGTWAPIGAAFSVSTVSGNKVLAVHIAVGAYTFIRLRESTTIVGSVAAYAESN